MKRKILICGLALLLAVGGARIYYVNATAPQVPVEYYEAGEFVEIGKNFSISRGENAEGYSVRVDGFEVKPYGEYVKAYGETEDYLMRARMGEVSTGEVSTGEDDITPQHVAELTLTFSNTNNTEGGVFLQQYLLQYQDFVVMPTAELWALSQKNLGGKLVFKLRENTEMTFRLPYAGNFYQEKTQGNYFMRSPRHLLISQYPVKKLIRIP